MFTLNKIERSKQALAFEYISMG